MTAALTPITRVRVEQEPGVTLVAEARSLMASHDWRGACTVLEAAAKVRGDDTEIDGLLAVAAVRARKRSLAESAVARLREHPDPDATSMTALSAVALAREDFVVSDILARRAIEKDAENADAWLHLAAGYAGLGWFDTADDCLDHAITLGADLERDGSELIGSAVNSWAMTKTWALPVAAVLFAFLGLLAVAVGITIPFLTREVRMTRISSRYGKLADQAWARQHRLRLLHCAAVTGLIGVWTLTVGATAGLI